jgi:hypothetical protein
MTKIINDINQLLKTLLNLANRTLISSIFTILNRTKEQLENLYYIYFIKQKLEEEVYKEQINTLILYMCIIITINNFYKNQKRICY